MEEKVIKLTEKSAAVLEYMKAHDNGEEGYTGEEIATALELNPKGIHGVINSLVKYELVGKNAGAREGEFINKAGEKVMKSYTVYFLTDAGRAFQA